MIEAKGVETIELMLEIGKQTQEAYMRDVYYVPDLQGNLFSIHKASKLGNMVTFDKKGCTIRNRAGKTVGIAKMDNSLFRLITTQPSKVTRKTTSRNEQSKATSQMPSKMNKQDTKPSM